MSGTELALRQADPIALGQVMHESNMFPDTRSAAQAVVKILAGQEYGLGPVAAMTGIHIIDNKPVPGATVLAGLVKRSARYEYVLFEHDNTKCVLDFFDTNGKPFPRPDTTGMTAEQVKAALALYERQTAAPGRYVGCSSFDMEDAKKASLASRKNWQNYPRNMLFARALANGTRWYCPDVTAAGVVLLAEEMADSADIEMTPSGPGGAWVPVTVEPERRVEPVEATVVEEIPEDWRAPEAVVTAILELAKEAGFGDAIEEGGDPWHTFRLIMALEAVPTAGEIEAVVGSLTRPQFEATWNRLEEEKADNAKAAAAGES